MTTVTLQELVSQAKVFFEYLRQKEEPVLVISHYDADGLSSASIFSSLFSKLEIPFHLVFVEQTYPDTLEDLPFEDYNSIAFLDLGSGYKDILRQFVSGKNVLIVDHHVPTQNVWENLIEINPYNIGLDASTHTSSSTLSYSILRMLMGENKALLPAAIAGALGDRLDVGERFSLIGLNKEVLEIGKRLGIIEESVSLRLFGTKNRPIVEALASTMEPFIPGLSGNPSACIKFLEKIGIPPKTGSAARIVATLTSDEIKHLASELIKYMISQGVNVKEAEKIFGYNYYIVREPESSPLKNLREYAFTLNALGRLDHYGTAISLNLGHRGRYIARAEDSIKEYRRLLARQLSRIFENQESITRHGKFTIIYFLEDPLPKLTGPISSIIANEFASSLKNSEKKIIGVASPTDKGKYKISFRKIDDNVDIGTLLQKLSRELGFIGGGHPSAGGALIDEKTIDKLLERI
ncbi:MAG: DHH family phosphoesterase [Infirmifilum sp.]